MGGWLRTAGRWLIGALPPAEFDSDTSPDWVADIRLTCLPPGRVYAFRVRLWPDRGEVLGSVCWWLLPFVRSPVPGSGALPAESATELRELAARAFDEPAPRPSVLVRDGMPCRVRLFRREPFGVAEQSWNLAAWSFPPEPSAALPPMVQLVAAVYSKHA